MPKARTDAGPLDDLTQLDQIQRVVANPDPVTRNLQITQTYHQLAEALDAILGDRKNDNWCAFASWASKQAGRYIRNDEVPEPLRRFLGIGADSQPSRWTPRGWLRRKPFLAYIRVTVEDVSAHLAEGNRLVCAKLAPMFSQFLALYRGGRRPSAEQVEEFLRIQGQDPTTGSELIDAFRQFSLAFGESAPKLRAERIYLANVQVGLHEQRRLQDSIDGSLSAPIRQALQDPERRWSDWPVPAWLRRLGARAFRRVMAPAIRSFEDEWKEASTRCLMTLALPGETLRLGDDLPPLPGGGIYPSDLQSLSLPEAEELVQRLDRTPHTTRGSAARDWTLLGDRMNYVVDFFRSRQQDRSLLQAPFNPQQVDGILRGRVPKGRL